MKRIKKALSLLFVFVMTLSVGLMGCKSPKTSSDQEEYTFNRDYFFGMCDPSGSLGGGVDKAITNEWLGDVSDVMGIKSFRLWVSLDGNLGGLFNVDIENNLTFNQAYLLQMQKAYHSKGQNQTACFQQNILLSNLSYCYYLKHTPLYP